MMENIGKRIFTTVISLIIIPLFLFAQEAEKVDYEEVCERAKMKAQENVSGEVYFVASVFLGPIGVWLAYASEIPQPPIEEILNKPSDYLIVYKQCYSQEAKRNKGIMIKLITVVKILFPKSPIILPPYTYIHLFQYSK